MPNKLYDYIASLPYHRRLVIGLAIADITPKELAYAAGMAPPSIHVYRTGHQKVSDKRRQQFADIIGSKVPMMRQLLLHD